jgi:hypothetical protein
MKRALSWIARTFAVACILGSSAIAGMVQLVDGTVHVGDVSIDGGILVRGKQSVKLGLNNVLFARFTNEAAPRTVPSGLVLTNGTRIAGAFSSAMDEVVVIEAKGVRVPGREVAWAVYQPFDPALADGLVAGKTGALLAAGDFFEGPVKNADAKSAKVINSIFGPRVFTSGEKGFHAVILRPVQPQLAAFEVVTQDGSRYLALDLAIREAGAVILRHPHYDGLRIKAADILEIRAAPARIFVPDNVKPARVGQGYAISGQGGAPLRLTSKAVQGCVVTAGEGVMWKKTIRGGTFVARVAPVPEAVGGNDKLTFVVEADGRVLFRSPPTGVSDPPHLIRCTVPAAESFTLRVEGRTGTQGLWADPVILLR